jgi:tetratricopeptide (TPR) repeat protein
LSEPGEIEALRGDGRPSALIKTLQALGLRGHEQDARALLGAPPPFAERLSAALADIERLEANGAPTAWSHALKGRLLFLLRQTARARVECDLAVALNPSLLEARLWRAQASIVERDAASALADLDALAAARRPSGWEDYLRGLCLMTLGHTPEAARRLRVAARRGMGARADSFLALALAEQGRIAPALKILAAAKSRAGTEAVPLAAFEGLILRQAGDLEGSLRALIRAGRYARPYPWVFSHRADVHNRMGFYQQALVDLKRFHELLPRESAAFAQAANVLYDQAYYGEALRALKAAAQLAPKDADLQARRAQILVSAGREAEAVRVLRGGLRLAPDDVHLREELIEAAVMSGQAARARAEIKLGGLTETPFGRVMLGVLFAREGRRNAAQGMFAASAAGLSHSDPMRDRALFYGMILRVLKTRGGRSSPGLRLCGVGVRHPFQLSVETLRALAESETIFTNLPDIEARRFLALFPGRVLSIPRRPDQGNRDRALWVVRRLRAGKTAAFLTRIHPFIYRRMGWDLLQLCRAKGVPVRAYGAVSLTELVGCRSVDEGCGADAGAVRVFDISYLNRNPDQLRPTDSTVIYCIGEDSERPRLVRLLRRSYPSSGGAYFLGGSGEREDRAPWVPWRKIGMTLRLGDIGCVLFIPGSARRGGK